MKVVIYAPPFHDDSGGIIALHKLCHLLNKRGVESRIFPYFQHFRFTPQSWPLDVLRILKRFLFYPVLKYKKWKILISYLAALQSKKKWFKHFKAAFWMVFFAENSDAPEFITNWAFDTPVTYYFDVEESVLVYPETIAGNPLKAKNIVRWFLHRPGYHSGQIDYGKGELYFFYQIIFNDPSINPDPDNLLRILHVPVEIYNEDLHKPNRQRQGTCYILRKGKNRELVHELKDSLLIDGRPHTEVSQIFNEVETFISYDTATFYSHLAVLCGCKSVVIPLEGLSKEQWQPKKELRFGIAYGFEDLVEAEKTRHLLLPFLLKDAEDANESLSNFIMKCKKHFFL